MIKLKNYKHPAFWLLFFCFTSLILCAQDAVIIRYADSSWSTTSKEQAYYFTEMKKEDSFYRCTSYWMKSKKLNCRSVYADTIFSRSIGLLVRYFENGQTVDSIYTEATGPIKYAYHYYPDGKLLAHYTYDLKTKKEFTEAFDPAGKPIDGFIYFREASFQEGAADWISFLSENIKTKVPVKNGAPVGKYQVIIRFIVDKDGKVSDIKPETNQGYGMEDEAIRVMKKSPRWNPAILLGKKVNAYRRQPLTFIVEEK